MKKVLAAVFLLIVTAVTVVVVLPETIDWNEYRSNLATRAENLTGRKMSIDGDIHVTFLPAPALIAQDVRMANVEGAAAPDMIRLKSLEIRVALGPLIGGTVQVETIKLIDPVIELERLADGRVNWEFEPLRRDTDGSASVALPGTDPDPAADADETPVSLDSFLIENGSIVFRDTQEGVVERFEKLSARLAAGSPSGPFESGGDLLYRGVPLGYEVSVGRVIQGRTVPLNMILTAKQGSAKAEVSGAIVDLTAAPRFKGKVVANSDGPGGLIDDMFGAGTAPAFLAEPIRVETEVIVSADDVDMKDVTISLGQLRAAGDAKVTFSKPVNIDAKLVANRIDLDALMAGPPATQTAKTGKEDQQPEIVESDTEPKPKIEQSETSVPLNAGFSIPRNLTGLFELSAEAITFRGSIISEARINAELAEGAIAIHQLSALMPGGSDVFANGAVTAKNGEPAFDGNLDAKISDLRRVMTWLGIEAPDVPSDRLRNAAFKGRIIADGDQIQGRDLDVTLDTSHITGAITLAKRKKLAFGARFKVDRLNLDAYLRSADEGPKRGRRGAKKSSPVAGGKNENSGKAGSNDANPLAFLGALNRFDTNLQLDIDRLTYLSVPFNKVAFDGTIFGGNVQIRSASVDDIAGAKARLSGQLVGLTQVPGLKGVHFELRGVDLARLLRQLEVDVPFSSKDVGIAELTGRADGVLLRPEFDLILKTPDASADLKGRLSILPIEPLFDGEIRVRHRDFPRFLRLLGIEYRPAGRLGGFGLSAKAKGDFSKISFDGLSGRIGPVSLNGALSADLTGDRPRLIGAMKTGRIVIDDFLPAKRSALLDPTFRRARSRTAIIPAAFVSGNKDRKGEGRLVRVAQAGGDIPWPTEKIDLSLLQAFDAELKLTSDALVFEDVSLADSALDATVTNGTFRAKSLTGRLFGGQLKGIATVYSAPVPRLNGSISLTGGDFGAAEKALRGESVGSGKMNFRVTFDSSGQSVAKMIAGLNGQGSAELMQIGVAADTKKGAAGPIIGLVSGLNDLVGLTGGGAQNGAADFSGSFKIDRGVARSQDLQFVSNVGEGTAKGFADLPAWKTKIEGDIRLSKNLFSQLLTGATGLELVVPFRVEGPLDNPDVVIDTGKLPGKALTIPGTLLKQSGKILQRILPIR